MGTDRVDAESIPLAVLLRHVGEVTNFKILKELTQQNSTPTELSRTLKISRSNVSSQLAVLRQLGFVTYEKEGLKHRYFISKNLPTLQHEFILDLIKLDRTDPDKNPLEAEHAFEIDDETREKLRDKKSERFRKKLSLLASYWDHPGLTSVGIEQEKLKEEIDRLDREINQIILS